MSMDHVALFSGGLASLLALSSGGLLLLRANARSQRLAARLALVVTPHTRVDGPSQARAVRRFEARDHARFEWLAAWLGCTAPAREASRAKWYVVLPLALVISRLALELGVAVIGPWAALATPVLWVFLSRMWWQRAESQRRVLLYRQFPDTLGMIVRAVRVGIPVSEAIRGAAREQPAPTSVVMGRLADQLAVGMPMDEALRAMADRCGVAEYRFFATALTLQAQTGGALTETLENLAEVIRKRLALKARAHAMAGEARMSAGILTVLPLLAAVALVILSPDYIMLLITDATGNKILAGAVIMLLTGMGAMRGLIRRALT